MTKVLLHPLTVKALKNGHPHITKDQYSDKFPSKERFLIGVTANNNQPICLFLHDPQHKKIKGRVWSFNNFNSNFNSESFLADLSQRIDKAIEKRILLNINKSRDNFYLIFAEADEIPGVFVTHLNDHIFIQIYCFFWRAFEKELIDTLKKSLQNKLSKSFHFHLQYREENKANHKANHSPASNEFLVTEFELKYKIDLSNLKDIGLYTDMASIRQRIIPYLAQTKNLLNLYCYTGAFSLLALKQNVAQVTSVDLSAKYLKILEENYNLNFKSNSNSNSQKHIIINQSVNQMVSTALNAHKKNNLPYDFVIIDPPSCSNDKNKTSSVMQMYQELLPKVVKLIADKGYLLIFVNNHHLSFKEFKSKINAIIAKTNNKVLIEEFKLSQDCPTKESYPEGDYLKGLLFQISIT
ncbi:MAG: class I SAM-dependent methyltransferase [Oligoflexia bacterium]|nr:class I SAM-dependent methyltransferase [Oligoflexia bacterium]